MIKKILISQPEPTSANSPYFDIMKRHNVEIVFRPFIKVERLTPKEFRAQKISILDHTAIVFTSRLSIDNFFLLAREMRIAIPEEMKYFCVTETVAQYIQKYVHGFEEYREYVKAFTPERTYELTGVPAEDIYKAAAGALVYNKCCAVV